jgi:hypothetical protein
VEIEIEFERRLDGFVLRNRCCVLDAVFTELSRHPDSATRAHVTFQPAYPIQSAQEAFPCFQR